MLSIDDLYLPHSGLQNVAARHPFNKLLQGRGLPGTHDIALGTQLLERLKRINNFGHEVEVAPLELPHFDKSLHGGQGDRLPHGALVKAPVDVVLFEGWFVGFGPISPDKLNERYENLIIPDLEGLLEIRSFSKEEIAEINENLKDYVDWWSFFDTFIQVSIMSRWRSAFYFDRAAIVDAASFPPLLLHIFMASTTRTLHEGNKWW